MEERRVERVSSGRGERGALSKRRRDESEGTCNRIRCDPPGARARAARRGGRARGEGVLARPRRSSEEEEARPVGRQAVEGRPRVHLPRARGWTVGDGARRLCSLAGRRYTDRAGVGGPPAA